MNKLIYTLLFILTLSCQTEKKEDESSIKELPTLYAKLFYKADAQLGEGPIWNYLTNELYWIDIEGKQLHILTPSNGKNRSIATPTQIGTVVPVDSVNAIIALVDGVWLIDIKTEATTKLAAIDSSNSGTRLNDGKADPSGRLWVGSMHWETSDPIGGLFMMERDGTSEMKLDSITVSNGIVWTADQKTMYYIDSPTGKVQGFDYDAATGQISNERTVIDIPVSVGEPDGMAIDEEGKLWIGLWDGNAVVRYDPLSGELMQKVEVPAHNVTACAFGGENLDSLFITTARVGMTDEETKAYPDAGSVFVVVPGVRGVKSDFFKPSE